MCTAHTLARSAHKSEAAGWGACAPERAPATHSMAHEETALQYVYSLAAMLYSRSHNILQYAHGACPASASARACMYAWGMGLRTTNPNVAARGGPWGRDGGCARTLLSVVILAPLPAAALCLQTCRSVRSLLPHQRRVATSRPRCLASGG